MEEAQQMEWVKAQDITFSVDLIAAAKQQLQFLAVVDSIGCLYEGPALERAIYRYKNCWLPLLAKHMNSPVFEGPLVVPLDCEWIWHCHRLNPVQYNSDCEKIYGKTLGDVNVLSTTTEEACPKQTKSLWERIYVTEPYILDLSNVETVRTNNGVDEKAHNSITIEYDLVAAVTRQKSFFSKVSKMMMNSDDDFISEAVARYKAFNHLIKIIDRRKLKCFSVPTLDIDLIWHSHQLNPLAYHKDMKAMHGKLLDHNDRVSGSVEGKKMMDLSFVRTKQIWEVVFGKSYSIGESVPLPKNKYSNLLSCATRECFHTCLASEATEDAAACARECFHTCLASEATEDAAACARECFHTCLASEATEDAAACARECFHTCLASEATEDAAACARECFHTCLVSKASADVAV